MNRWALLFLILLLELPGGLYAAPAQTAELLWRYGTGGMIRSRPAVAPDGTVYAISEDGYLYALSPAGELRWRCNLGWIVADCLAVGIDGTIYAGLQNDELVAVNPRGTVIWRVRLGGLPEGDPVTTADGRLYVATAQGSLSELSHTGEVLWRRQFPSAIVAPLVMDGAGTLYIATADRLLHAMSREGRTLWTHAFESDPGAPAVGTGGALLVGTGAGGLYLLSPSGKVLWKANAEGEPCMPLAAGAEESGAGRSRAAWIVATRSGEIIALSSTGTVLWRRRVAPLIDEDYFLGTRSIVVLTSEGSLVLLDEKGAVVGRLSIAARGGGILTSGARLYIGGRDWIIYAVGLPTEAALDGTSSWPEAGHDAAHSGRSASPTAESSQAFWTGDPFSLYLESLLAHNTRGSLSQALAEVKRRFEEGTLKGSVDLVVPILERIAGSGTLYPTYEDNRLTNDFPLLRAEAATLLGYLGTLGSRNLLIRLIGREGDDLALAAEIEALGRLGSDPDGSSLRAIAEALRRTEAAASNEQVAAASVAAMARIAAYEGQLADPSAVAALDSIVLGDYPADIRMQAAGLLEKSSE